MAQEEAPQGAGEPVSQEASKPQGTGDANPPASGLNGPMNGPMPNGPTGQQGEGAPPAAGNEQGGPDAAGTGPPPGKESGDAGQAADGAERQEGGGSGTDDTKPSKDTSAGKKPGAGGKAKEAKKPSSDPAKSEAKGDKPAAAKKPDGKEPTKKGSKAAKPDASSDSKGDKPAAAEKPGNGESAKPGSSESTKQGGKAAKPDANGDSKGDKPTAAEKPGNGESARPSSIESAKQGSKATKVDANGGSKRAKPGSSESTRQGGKAAKADANGEAKGDKPAAAAGAAKKPGSRDSAKPNSDSAAAERAGSPNKSDKPGSKQAGKRQKSPKQKPPVVVEEVSEDEGPPPNPSWPNGPPEAGGTYVPVAELPPIPEAHGFNGEGQPIPLPNVEPVFLTGTTIEILGLSKPPEEAKPAAADDAAKGEGAAHEEGTAGQGDAGPDGGKMTPPPQQPEQQQQEQQQQADAQGAQQQDTQQAQGEMQGQEQQPHEQQQQQQPEQQPPPPPQRESMLRFASKHVILKDIQFRGAISDLHAFKQKIQEANYNPLCFRINEDDIFGDGTNFQLALSRDVAKLWRNIEYERARREQCLVEEQQKVEVATSQPRFKREYEPKPWQSQGSELEVEEAMVRPRREPLRIVLSRPRVEFNQAYRHYDKDAHELWNSSQMECRPFKDPNYDLKRMEQSVAVQAVKATAEEGVQAGAVRLRPNATQAQPPDFPPEAKRNILREGRIDQFLQRVSSQCEQALIQNEITDIFRDDFNALSEEDGMSGNRKESIISEYQSFTHLTYSKNKVVSAVQWLPHRKGVVAVACTEAASHSERVAKAGRPSNAYILIWNFKDPIHPEYVLQAPFEVFSFQYNPSNPDIIAGGCYNGQVVLWDTTHEHERIAHMKAASNKQETQDAGDEAAIPIVKCKYATTIEFSHHHVIMDLQWLPGIEISTRGKVTKADPRECSFLATTSGDGKVNFWDVRVERLMKKGRKAEDSLELIWKPTHSIHIISLIGMDLGGLRMCFNFRELYKGAFFVGSADGELVYAEFVRPEGEENPEYTKSCVQAHVAPIMALERSPFFDDVILTVGDWSFQIWREGHTSPLFASGYGAEMYTCGCWSPSRPAVIYLTDQAGNLEVWDMLDRSHEPSIKVTLASTPFMSMSFMGTGSGNTSAAAPAASSAAGAGPSASAVAQQQQQAGQFLALGDSVGVLRIVEIPRNLRRPMQSERKAMAAFLEREGERVADVEARKPLRDKSIAAAEEARKKAADEAEAAAKDSAAQKDQPHQPASPTKITAKSAAHLAALELDEKAEAEYFKLENKLKVQLGLIEEAEAESPRR